MFLSQVAETQDAESAIGSDCSSILDWKPNDVPSVTTPPAPTMKKTISAISVKVMLKYKLKHFSIKVIKNQVIHITKLPMFNIPLLSSNKYTKN